MRFIRIDETTLTRAEARARGLDHYYTANRCKNGHIAERRVADYRCVRCAEEATPNTEAKRAWGRAWYARNKEKCSQRAKAQYQKHKERRCEWQKKYREANLVRARERAREYQRRNPEKARVRERNRHAKKRAARGKHTANEITKLLKLQKCRCANCQQPVKDTYHADHIMPLSRGGSNDIRNIQILCPTCNMRKHAKDPFEWARENGRLL